MVSIDIMLPFKEDEDIVTSADFDWTFNFYSGVSTKGLSIHPGLEKKSLLWHPRVYSK